MSLDVTVRGTMIPADELTWRFSRSPGPGGQSVNTADTRVELSYDLLELPCGGSGDERDASHDHDVSELGSWSFQR